MAEVEVTPAPEIAAEEPVKESPTKDPSELKRKLHEEEASPEKKQKTEETITNGKEKEEEKRQRRRRRKEGGESFNGGSERKFNFQNSFLLFSPFVTSISERKVISTL